MKVIGVIPAGRTRFMRVLFPHLLQQTGVDEFEIWENTNIKADREYMHDFASTHSDRFRVEQLPFGGVDGSGSIRHFMRFCCDPDTVYVRIDDDICWMAPDCLQNLVDFRLAEPSYFLTYANIINNNIGSYLHQKIGAMTSHSAILKCESMCADAMTNPAVACEAHDCFREHYENGTLDQYKFPYSNWINVNDVRICINLMSWYGRDMHADGREFVDRNEEIEMAVRLPKERNQHNTIVSNALAVHYSYGTQIHGVPDSYLDWYATLIPTVQQTV